MGDDPEGGPLSPPGPSRPPRIAPLAAASFATGTEAYVYVGHLEALCRALGVSVAEAGLLATSFAITYAVGAPVIASVAARVDRRRLVVGGLVAVGALNLAAALAPSFAVLLALRVACGLAAATVGPAASAAAAALAPPERRGRAIAVVLAGLTLAFILGIPLGSVVGDLLGWRATFAFAGLVALCAAAVVAASIPAVAGAASAGLRRLAIAFDRAILATLSLTVLGFLATFTVVAYIGPVAAHIAGLHGSEVGALQATVGVGSIVGIAIGARFADGPRAMAMVAASFAVAAVSLASYSALTAVDLGGTAETVLLALGMTVGSATLFARSPAIQARLVALAPGATGEVLALAGSMVFVGQGLGAALGAIVIATSGLGALGVAASTVSLVGLGTALLQQGPARPVVAAAPAGR